MFYPFEVRTFLNRALGHRAERGGGGSDGAPITLFELLDPAVPEIHKSRRLF